MEKDEKPVEKTEEKPAEKPTEKPAEKLTEKPETVTVVSDPATEARANKAETELHQRRVKDVLRDAASDRKTGIRDANLIAALIDPSKITFDDKGNAKGLKDEIDRLKKAHPIAFYDLPGSGDGGAGGESAGESGNDWLRRALGR